MRNQLKFYIGRVHLKIKFKWFLAKVKFFDLITMISKIPDSPGDADYCIGANYVIKLFDLKTVLEALVWTCQYPMIGQSIGDIDDCLWMLYPVEQPLADIKKVFPALKLLDLEGEIFPWTCSYDYAASIHELEEEHANGGY